MAWARFNQARSEEAVARLQACAAKEVLRGHRLTAFALQEGELEGAFAAGDGESVVQDLAGGAAAAAEAAAKGLDSDGAFV
jgi:hypothetical protein